MAPALVQSDQRRRELHAALPAVANEGFLPTDVVYEVLLRLPANVLCRLRLVCRSWRSLTSDPIFARAHFSRHLLIVGLRDVASRREVQFVDLSGNIVKRICITGQCFDNGYMVSTQPFFLCTSSTKKVCVFNPSTGGFTALPVCIAADAEYANKGRLDFSFSLLGRIPSTGEYKVLRIHKYLEPEQTCEVMTVGDSGNDGRWMARASPPICVAATPVHAVVINGIAYFMKVDRANARGGDIALFDLTTEEWRPDTLRGTLSGLLPVDGEENRVRFHLTKMNRCLVTICRYYS